MGKTKSIQMWGDPLSLYLHVCMPCRSLSVAVVYFFLQSLVMVEMTIKGPCFCFFFKPCVLVGFLDKYLSFFLFAGVITLIF